MFDRLTQVSPEEHACPEGFCEVWVGTFRDDRHVENTSELYGDIIPGIRHVTSIQPGTREVLGYFYVPAGASIVPLITQHP